MSFICVLFIGTDPNVSLFLTDFLCAIVKEMSTDPSKQVKLGFLSGLVPREKSMSFERILFRATRGNIFLKQAVVENPVIDPVSGEKVLICYCNI